MNETAEAQPDTESLPKLTEEQKREIARAYLSGLRQDVLNIELAHFLPGFLVILYPLPPK